MSDPLFPQGTKATWATWSGTAWGTATELKDLRGGNGNTRTMSFSDVTSLLDTAMRKRPARLDYGTLTLSFTMTDEAIGTNQLHMFREALEDRKRHKVVITLPPPASGTAISLEFECFIQSVSTPDVEISDNVLTFTVALQVEPPLPGTHQAPAGAP